MRFLPANRKENLAAEFERSKQIAGMSVTEYKAHFPWLPKYAPHLVPTKTKRVRRFVWGPVDPLFTIFFPMIERISYAEIVDAEYSLESRKKQQKVTKESSKK